jgi:hypothetical protein
MQYCGSAGLFQQFALLDVTAATLNQNAQNDDKQNAGNNPDEGGTVHLDSSFLSR